MALMQQTRLQDADITERVEKDVKYLTLNPLKAPSGSPAKSLRLDSETPGHHRRRPECLHRMILECATKSGPS